MVPFRMMTRRHPSAVMVTVTGAVDVFSAQTLGNELVAAFEHSFRVVCDISAVDFVDSMGLGSIVNAGRMATRFGGSLELVCTNPFTLKLLGITGLDDLFVVHRSPEGVIFGAAVPA